MSQNNLSNPRAARAPVMPYGWIMIIVLTAIAGAAVTYIASPAGASVRADLAQTLAFDVANPTWFITRSAGILAYLLLWLSTVWGLAIPSKILDRVLHGSVTFEFHQYISLLSLGFLGLHVFILTIDNYLPYSWSQLLVPFLSPYEPLWVGIGVIAFYLTILVTVTFYLRRKIGLKSFRLIHYSSLIAYLAATAHSLFSGTDSALTVMQLMYLSTFLVFVFLLVYWLALVLTGRQSAR